MKEEDLKKMMQKSLIQTDEDFTEKLMDRIEAEQKPANALSRAQLGTGIWGAIGLVLILSFAAFFQLNMVPPLFFLLFLGVSLLLNHLFSLRSQWMAMGLADKMMAGAED